MIQTTGGKIMSAARIYVILSLLALSVVVVAVIGCEPERTGTALGNSPPQVFIVNTPPDSAQFSRNPDLNWYATDIDGYITMFRYTVVIESLMVISGLPVSPDEFARQATDQQMGWDTLLVDLDHPQSTATIRLYANVDFPVDSFVSQVFFIQARDDKGAMSDIKYRMYSRNNHYPNTHFRNLDVYINAKEPESPAPGIALTWDGADSLDWGRAIPPLEYEWRLYGPFDTAAPVYVKLVQEDCVFDPIGDSFVNCIDVPVLDLDNLPPAVGGQAQPLRHSQGPNFANDPNDVWVTSSRTTIYNVFEGMNLQKTSQYKFIFWVRTRDDGFVPDPTPSFGQFNVVEALFEKPVAVLDESGYTAQDGRWGPISLDTTKAVLRDYIHNAGFTDFVTELDTLTGITDYFFTTNRTGIRVPYGGHGITPIRPRLVDVLSHRILLVYHDDSDGAPNEQRAFGLIWWAFFGLDMGATSCCFARNLGGAGQNTERTTPIAKSARFAEKFGITSCVVEGWFKSLRDSNFDPSGIGFNEEFIGAYANPDVPGFPHIMLDYGPPLIDTIIQTSDTTADTVFSYRSLMDIRYPRYLLVADHSMEGLPEVGVGTRSQFATPVYLYLSKDGDKSIFNGKVIGVTQQIGDERSACFMFTPLAMDPEPMQQVFTIVFNWLNAKFETASKPYAGSASGYPGRSSDIAERRDRIQSYLEYLTEYAEPEDKQAAGITLRPYEISPASAVQ